MANKQSTQWMTIEAIRVYAGALERLASRARAAADALTEQEEPGVWCFGSYSRQQSEERGTAFIKDLEEAVDQLAAGRPFDEDADKKRRRGDAQRAEEARRARKYSQGKHIPKKL